MIFVKAGGTISLNRSSKIRKQLTEKEVTHFIEKGYIVIREVFSTELISRILPLVWDGIYIKQDEPST